MSIDEYDAWRVAFNHADGYHESQVDEGDFADGALWATGWIIALTGMGLAIRNRVWSDAIEAMVAQCTCTPGIRRWADVCEWCKGY